MILPITKHPNDVLRKRSEEVDHDFILSGDAQQLVTNMIETMRSADGVGLAAPQIGKNIRLVVIGGQALDNKNSNLVLFNPVWEKTNTSKNSDTEGCLSIPEVFGKVERYNEVKLTGLDQNGNQVDLIADKLLSRVIQHEVDHLDGILFIDRATEIEKNNPTP